jgi:hypothetical protein
VKVIEGLQPLARRIDVSARTELSFVEDPEALLRAVRHIRSNNETAMNVDEGFSATD